MLKLSKKADYGLIAVKHLAAHGADGACSAAGISEAVGISAPLMAKVLQKSWPAPGGIAAWLGRGYQLARDPRKNQRVRSD